MTDYLRLAQDRAPQAAEEQDGNPYMARAVEQQNLQQNRARTVLETALKDDPDLAAERQRLSQTSGLAPDIVQRNFHELKTKERARAVDLVNMAAESPVLYRQLTDASFTTTAVDDLDTLGNIEKAVGKGVQYVMGADGRGGLPRDLGGAAVTLGLGATMGVGELLLNTGAVVDDLIGWQSGAAGLRQLANRSKEFRDSQGFDGGTSTRDAIKSGLQSAGTNLALLPLGLQRGLFTTANQAASAVAGIMAIGVGADAYLTAREKGKGQGGALAYAIPEATFEYVFERIPASKLFGDIALNTGLLKTIGKQAVSEGWTEQVTTLAQDFNEWMNLNPDKTVSEFIAERPEAAYQTFVATLVGVGVQTSTIKGINKAVEAATDRSLQFDQDLLQQQMQMASASMLRQRSPEMFRAHIQRVVDNNDSAKKEVYIDGQVLNQLPAELLAQLPESVREALPGALETNSTVAMQMADVLTLAPGTELEQIINDNARIRPNSPSRAEAQLTEQYLQQEADRVLQQAADTSVWQQSADAVQTTILDQLNATGRFTPDVNEAYATLQTNFFSTMASRLGITPQEMYDRYSLTVAAQGSQGAVLDQTAYHGTPHTGITQFSTDNIGTGEGNQAQGWGLYFTSREEVANWYRDKLSTDGKGQTYTVDIPEDADLLDWDATLAEQPEKVRKALYASGYTQDADEMTGKELYQDTSDAEGNDRAASLLLLSLGVKGIKYQGGTGGANISGKVPNFVIFDGADVALNPSAVGGAQTEYSQSVRGTFNPQTFVLTLSESADLSTFLHESGHFFLEVMADLASQPNAPAQIVNDMTTVLQWFGVPDLATWNSYTLDQKREHHERWAESFEQYLFEGKAPSTELQPIFRRFRSWLVNVYKSLAHFMRGRGLNLSDDIRQVFDRMVATDEQIAMSEDAAGMLPDFDATNEAIEQLQARSLRDLKWTVNARGRALKALQKEAASLRKGVEAEVRAEVEQIPVYKAMQWLKKGETTDPTTGDLVKADKGYRLNTEALAEMYPDTMLGRPDIKALRGMTSKEGLHPDMVADMFGFENGDALVRSILDAEPMASVVEGMTDQRMLERHGDLATPEAREAAANEAVHNEARVRSLATELKAQAELMNVREDTGRTATNGRPITVNAITQAAKDFAQNLAARRRLKDLKNAAWQHRAAEARAGKRWQQLTAEGNTREAVQAKRDQLLNNYAAKALQDAQGEVRKVLDFFKRVTKGNDEKVVTQGRDPDVVNAMRAILAAYDVAPRLEKSALGYMEALASNDPATYNALKPSVDGALLNAKPLTDLTLEELRGLNDELRAMWQLAKRSRQMEVDGNLMDIEDAADQLLDRMHEIGVPDEVPGEKGAITDKQERGIKLRFARAILSRVEQWSERLDGKYGGPFLRLVFQPVKEAADRYRADRTEYRRKFTAMVQGIAGTMPPGPIAAPELGYTFGNARDSGTAELLHAILHTGNESNKRKLLLGRNWATQNEDGTLDTARWDAFVQRMIDGGKLTKGHYDFAQGVWDLLEQTKPLAQETHRQVFGRYFAEITADEFTTPFGTYRGGYVPAQTDSRLVKDAKLRELAEGENESMAYAFPSSPSGFTKSRVEYNKPLLLDIRALAQHMDKVLLFSHMQGAVTDVRRLLTNKRVSYALDRIDPGAYEGMLIPWLNRAAKQVVETPVVGDRKLSRFLSAARSRAGMALMFANLSNTFQQITGFSSAAIKVRPGLMMESTASFVADPKAMKRTVADASAFMKDRMLNEVGALNDVVEQIMVNPSLLERGQAWTQQHAYFLQAAVDNTMSPIIWTAAYNQAIEQGETERDAVRFADGVIRQTQGTTLPEDVSRFETGPGYARLFTQFVGYFNMMANTNATAMTQIVGEMGLRKGAGKLLHVALLGLLAPIWVAEAIAQAFKGGPDDEDKDGYLDDWLAAVFGMGTLKGLVAQVPIAGQAAQLVVNRFNDNPADDKFSLSPAVSLIESAVSSPASVYKAVADNGSAQKAVRDVAAAATLLTGLPIYGVARPFGYAAGLADERIQPTSGADLARGLVTGTASPESKTP